MTFTISFQLSKMEEVRSNGAHCYIYAVVSIGASIAVFLFDSFFGLFSDSKKCFRLACARIQTLNFTNSDKKLCIRMPFYC